MKEEWEVGDEIREVAGLQSHGHAVKELTGFYSRWGRKPLEGILAAE